jgi:AAA domain
MTADAFDADPMEDVSIEDIPSNRRGDKRGKRGANGAGPRNDGAPPIGANQTAKFKLVPFEDVKFVATEEWLVKGLLPRQGVAPVFGASQTLKSFAVLDLALHVAPGWEWAGRRTKQGPVVYIAAENAAGTRKRKAGFELAHADSLPSGQIPFYLIEAAPNLGTEKNDQAALIASIVSQGVSPALIIIDTLAQTLGGGEENGAGMVTFLSNATALANRFKCCVIPVHHAPLADDKRMRGHSSLYAGVDALLRAERQGSALATTLWLDKLKDDERGGALTLHLGRIVLGHDEDGDEVSTLVVNSIEAGAPEAPPGKVSSSIPRGQKLLMEVIAQAIDEVGQDFPSFADGPTVRAVSEGSVRSRYYMRIAEQAEPDEDADKVEGRRRKAFSRALKGAIDAKVLVARGREGVRMLWLP